MNKIKIMITSAIVGIMLFGGCSANKGSDFVKQQNNDYLKEEENKKYESIDSSRTEDTQLQSNTSNHLENAKSIRENVDKAKSDDTIEIKENVFISQINDIYFNFDDYKDKTIIVEGIYSIFESAVSDMTSAVVYRNGPGCCDNDGWAGFLLKYNGEIKPKENDWIRVTGTPELEKTEEGYVNLYLNVSDMQICDKRGLETVMQ